MCVFIYLSFYMESYWGLLGSWESSCLEKIHRMIVLDVGEWSALTASSSHFQAPVRNLDHQKHNSRVVCRLPH